MKKGNIWSIFFVLMLSFCGVSLASNDGDMDLGSAPPSLSSSMSNAPAAAPAAPVDMTPTLLGRGAIVRVWAGQFNGGENVGHVSLQTARDYISFWPGDGDAPGEFLQNFQEDLDAEDSRQPEHVLCLPHPSADSVDGIHSDFTFLEELLAEDHLRWSLAGEVQSLKREMTRTFYDRGVGFVESSFTDRRDLDMLQAYKVWSYNCASLVYNILKNRGYFHKLSFKQKALNTSISPDKVAAACAEEELSVMYKIPKNNLWACFDYLVQQHTKGQLRLGSDQEYLFARYMFKSIGGRIVENRGPQLIEDVIRDVKSQKQESLGGGLARIFSASGLPEVFGHLLKGAGTGGKK